MRGRDMEEEVDHTAEIEALRAERDALKAQLVTADAKVDGGGRRLRFRQAVAMMLVILACLFSTVAVSAGWARRTLFNTSRWIETVTPIVDHPSVTTALSRKITSEVLTLVNAQSVAEEALPPRAQLLVGPMTKAVGDFVENEVKSLLQSDAFKQLWVRANSFAQPQVVAVLHGEGDVLSSQNGKVVLNLVPVVNQVLKRIEARGQDLFERNVKLPEISSGEVPEAARQKLEAALGVPIPPDLGEIVIFQSNKLESAQDAVSFFDRTLVIVAAFAIVTIFAALMISRNRRRTLIQTSAGIVVGLVIMRRLVMYEQDEIVGIARSENREAARAIVEDVMRGFFSLTEILIIVGIIIIGVALLTGPYGLASAIRSRIAAIAWAVTHSTGQPPRDQGVASWVHGHRDALQLGGAIIGVLLLLVFDLSWGSFLAVAILVLLYEVVVYRLGKRPALEPSP
jgi:hypothetical protein